jgi:hypothetical protein
VLCHRVRSADNELRSAEIEYGRCSAIESEVLIMNYVVLGLSTGSALTLVKAVLQHSDQESLIF